MSFISRLYFSSPAAGLALALLSALCLVVSIPTIDWWPFAWIAFVPVMVALYDQMKTGSLWRVYTIALTFSFFTGVGKVYWIAETVMSYGGLNLILGVFSMAVVASLLGVSVREVEPAGAASLYQLRRRRGGSGEPQDYR